MTLREEIEGLPIFARLSAQVLEQLLDDILPHADYLCDQVAKWQRDRLWSEFAANAALREGGTLYHV